MKKLTNKLLFSIALLILSSATSQNVSAASGPAGIVKLPDVDLSAYETEVATQLVDARVIVEQLLVSPAPDPLKLSQSYGYLGKLYHAYGLLPAAQACYSNAGAITPKELVWPYLYSVVANEQGQQEEAITGFKYVLAHSAEDLPSRIRLAKILRESGDFDGAHEQLMAIQGEEPTLAVVQAELGELALAKGNNEEAVDYLSNALEQLPEANRLHYPLAIALRNLGQQGKAREHMSKRGDVGIKVNDPFIEEIEQLKVGERVHLLRGKLAFAAGDYRAASKAFQAAVEARPDSARAYVNLGVTMSTMGQAKESEQQFVKALELDPDNVTAHYNLGATALHKGELDTAESHLRKVAELSPEDAEVHLMLANLLLRKNAFGEAFGQFQATAKLDSKSQAAWMGMTKLLIAAEQYKEAAVVLAQAHQAMPDDERISHALARMLAASPDQSLRNAKEARRLAYQTYQNKPSLDRAYTVSLALAESGECQQAANFLEQAWPKFTADKENTPEKVSLTVDYYRKNEPCRSAPVW